MNVGFVIDNAACIGCHACSTACKSENQVPVGVHRTWVKYTEVGQHPDVRRSFQVTRCNHCSNPPCVRICPVSAMFQRDDGIVDFDSDACIGCKGCMQACPYDAIHLDPETHTAAKCNYCAHRTDIGLEPACVVVCPEHAIIAGDLDDPESEISRVVAKHNVAVRKPEQGTAPKVFYIEGHEPSLRPTAAAVPSVMMWADVVDDPHWIGDVGTRAAPGRTTTTHPHGRIRVPDVQGAPSTGPLNMGGNMAEHMVQVAFTSRHKVQWHWQIPVYMVTKGIAGGVFALWALATLLPGASSMVHTGVFEASTLGLAMLGVTLALLIADLDRPDRFFYLFVRPQWRSWIARAAWLLGGFGLTSMAWWAAAFGGVGGMEAALPWLAAATLPFAVLAAIYTAFLFAQAEGRDLWQNPGLPLQFTLHAGVLGSGALAAFGGHGGLFAGALALSLLTTLVSDLAIAPPSANARLAQRDMAYGRYAGFYWGGGILAGHVLPLVFLAAGSPAAAFVSAAVGLVGWSWAFVMAPQRISNS